MSVMPLGKDHFDLLITAALAWELDVPERADEIGAGLQAANDGAYGVRYSRRSRPVRPHRFAAYPGRVDPQVVENAAACLLYNSDEDRANHADAVAWAERLRQEAERRIPEWTERFGPVDPAKQPAGMSDWWITRHLNGRVEVSGAGWPVKDRGLFERAARLRELSREPVEGDD